MTEAVQSTQQSAVAVPRWREVWQVPMLCLAAVLLVGGLAAVVITAPRADMSGGLVEAQKLMSVSLEGSVG